MTDVRLRQAELCARDLEATVKRLRSELGLGEPYRDPDIAWFGMENAVFAIGDTFFEVVSPVRPEEPGARTAAKQLDRAAGDVCGYMAMLQVSDLTAARGRAADAGVREAFEVDLDDISEVHLHPGDMRGAIVALSEPKPPESWRWGGEGWRERAVEGAVTGITLAVADVAATQARWESIAGGPIAGVTFVQDEAAPGIVAVELEIGGEARTVEPSRL